MMMLYREPKWMTRDTAKDCPRSSAKLWRRVSEGSQGQAKGGGFSDGTDGDERDMVVGWGVFCAIL